MVYWIPLLFTDIPLIFQIFVESYHPHASLQSQLFLFVEVKEENSVFDSLSFQLSHFHDLYSGLVWFNCVLYSLPILFSIYSFFSFFSKLPSIYIPTISVRFSIVYSLLLSSDIPIFFQIFIGNYHVRNPYNSYCFCL